MYVQRLQERTWEIPFIVQSSRQLDIMLLILCLVCSRN